MIISPLRTLLLCLPLLLFSVVAQAYNLRQISKRDGLTNSAIQSMCQDDDGVMWFGSVDGLNLYNGVSISPFRVSDELSLPGNLIEDIIESPQNIFWIQTNYGLARYDRKRRKLDTFEAYHSNYRLRKGGEFTELFFISEHAEMVYCHAPNKSLYTIAIEGLSYSSLLDYLIDEEGTFWLFCNNGKTLTFSIRTDKEGKLQLLPTEEKLFTHARNLISCFHEGNTLYFVDDTHTLYEYDLAERKKYYIDNIREPISRRGEISSIIKHGKNFFIGFKTGGLICLRHTPESQRNYRQEEIEINSGIFCIAKDRRQDIVWIGTDGQGVYIYSDDLYSIRSTVFEQFTHRIKKPTRCLLLDRYGSLWIGTKGDGLVRIPNYRSGGEIDPDKVEYHTTGNSALASNSVYCVVAGRHNTLWIGSDGGVNYYTYGERRMRKLDMAAGCETIRFVHSIYEEGDSVLWVATVGTGIVRVSLKWNGNTPRCTKIERFTIRDGGMSSNYFFSLHAQNDSLLWFGNRGYGALMMNPHARRSQIITFDLAAGGNRTVNDIFCITSDHEGNTWFGTSYGLVKRTPAGEMATFGKRDGLLNNTVHGILHDSKGNLWLSTNMGLAKFDLRLATFLSYCGSNGMEVIEYSDGASFRDNASRTLYFGGINGFTTVTESEYTRREFFPPVVFDRLTIFGKDFNIYDFLTSDGENGTRTLKLNYRENFFSVSFSAIDYINGSNHSYLYRLEGLGSSWIDNGSLRSINFTNITPGHYTLHVKYRNRETGTESPLYRMKIIITPPWYASTASYFAYAALLLVVIWWSIRSVLKIAERKRQRMMDELKAEHQQEVYESKLRFFTNIAHEFCTPLTLICGPCNRIMNYPNADPFVLKYTGLIQRNADRLNDLIQELIEFRRVESGNKQMMIEPLDVSALITGVAEGFNELAESAGHAYIRQIIPGIEWNSDKEFLFTIVTNLISNAFKYVDKSGKVSVAAEISEEKLHLVVSNTGRGIAAQNIERVFDRYNILERFENQGEQISSRHGLGLAISSGMIRLLGGDIRVESIPDLRTDFIVDLPRMEPTPVQGAANGMIPTSATTKPTAEYATTIELPHYYFDLSRQTIMIIDDDTEMLWFISEIFAGEYNVIPVNKSSRVEHILAEIHPDVIICDVMMPETDGITITRQVKADPRMAHVPLILISAKHQVEEQIRGIEAGAEMYIAKPFSVDYLRAFVYHLISRKKTLKEYFNSPLSAYELTEGKMLHVGHRRFVQKIIDIINSNITNKELSVQFIADRMNMSARHLYRRINEIGAQSPLEMIRECRMHVARDLLLNSQLTIDEIIYKSGFSSRSPFFKAFVDKYGSTPKEFREKHKNQAATEWKTES